MIDSSEVAASVSDDEDSWSEVGFIVDDLDFAAKEDGVKMRAFGIESYPPQPKPADTQRAHNGLDSSHLTLRFLQVLHPLRVL